MRIAICDDSVADAEYLKILCLSRKEYENFVIDAYANGTDLLEVHLNDKYDIIFLDVDMPNQNGIEIGKIIKSETPKTIIIFSTSYPQYAIEAYECEAFHYLLKPCDSAKLYQVIDRAIGKLNVSKKYHLIKARNETIRLKLSDIYYIECCRKHIIYYTKTEKYDTIDTLSNVYDQIKDFGFFQIHQGYIVNFDKVKCFRQNDIILDNDRVVMMSIRKKKETLLAYSRYLEEYL
ncbi:MAG: response regulator transcription factor [Clostridia bacterium]|nr:response regulator transcription factor [Clostridia bacterium]